MSQDNAKCIRERKIGDRAGENITLNNIVGTEPQLSTGQNAQRRKP